MQLSVFLSTDKYQSKSPTHSLKYRVESGSPDKIPAAYSQADISGPTYNYNIQNTTYNRQIPEQVLSREWVG